jgi:sugar (pentulose or hexulose) kinase
MNSITKDLVIGLDIGTSSLKLIVLNLKTNNVELELKQSTESSKIAFTKPDCVNFNEQNVDIIVELVKLLFDKIPINYLDRMRGIQLCGQMHGILLWNRNTLEHTNLITWQGNIKLK